MNGAGLLAGRERDFIWHGFLMKLPSIEDPAEAVLLPSILWDELRRTSSDTNIAGVTATRLDDGFMCSSFRH
jgi:hypothetical protein